MFALEARQLAREGDCSRAVVTLNIFGTQGVRRGLFSIDADDRVFRSIRTGDGHRGLVHVAQIPMLERCL